MKRKFSKILGVGLTLALLASLLLVAAPVSAVGTAVTDVWVDFPSADNPNDVNDSGGGNEYLVHFKPFTALSRGVDWVTVTFPDGASAMGPGTFTIDTVAKADLNFSTDFGTAFSATWILATVDATINGHRVKVRMPIDVDAGADVWLSINSANVDAPGTGDPSNAYKVYVQTTQDTARVLSSAFSLDVSSISHSGDDLVVTPATVGLAAEYTLVFQVTNGGATTVTVKLPMGVGMPDDMDAAEVLFSLNGVDWEESSSTPVVNAARRTVTAATSLALATGTDNYMKIVQGAGLTNPTTARNDSEAVMKTAKDAQWLLLDTSTVILADTATKLVFVAATSDNATIVNAFTKVIKLESQDQYGNPKDPATDRTVLVATNGTGQIHTDTGGSYPWGTSQALASGLVDVFYLPTVVGTGTHTLTATVVTGTALTLATFDVSVVPKVVLTDSDGNELSTYGPSFSYTADIKSADYIRDAINAAGAGDTVTLGDGIYEMWESHIIVDKAITVTSVNGADFTTIRRHYSGGGDGIMYLTSRATISGLHLLGYLPGETQDFNDDKFGVLIRTDATAENYGYVKNNKIEGFRVGIGNADIQADYWKIQDNVLDNNRVGIYGDVAMDYWIISGNTITNYYVGIARFSNAVESLIIKNNNLNGINSSVLTEILDEGDESVGIQLNVSDENLVITQNTFTANDYGIKLKVDAADTVVKYNDFIDNNLFGIGASGDNYGVTALHNWWGDATGPSTGTGTYASTAKGSGDAISAGTNLDDPTKSPTYKPWLHKSKVDVVADNADYPTFTRSLSVGWNTLSVPAKLISAANALDELVPTGKIIAYKYDGSWVEVIATDVINPLDGIYIKMSSAQTVLLKVDGAVLSAPTKSLAEGWNLIGLASLATKQDLEVEDLLPRASFGQLVSPSVNADTWVLTPGLAFDDSSQGTLAIGEGYWLFMKSAATMAAFDVLPLVPDFN